MSPTHLLLRTLLALAFVVGFATQASAATVIRTFFTQSTTIIGGASPRVFSDAGATISAGGNASSISVEAYDTDPFRRWGFNLLAPQGQSLGVGTYPEARDSGGAPTHPRIIVSPGRASCTTIDGRFAILELQLAGDGTVQKLAFDFEVVCQSYDVVMKGNVRINSEIALDSPAPQAYANLPQSVEVGATVNLDGSHSRDPLGTALTYAWMQEFGPAVSLSNPAAAQATFVAPSVAPGGADLGFRLTVTNGNAVSSSTTTSVHVAAATDPRTLIFADTDRRAPLLLTPQQGTFTVAPFGDRGISFQYNGGEIFIPAWFQTASAPFSTGTHAVTTPGFAQPGMVLGPLQVQCGSWTGSFTVLEYVTDMVGAIVSLAIDYEQNCVGNASNAVGSLRFNSAIPYNIRTAVTTAQSMAYVCCEATNSFPVGSTGPAFAIRTLDAQGNSVSGRPVRWDILDGCAIQVGGASSATVLSDAAGIATVPAITSASSAYCRMRVTLVDNGMSSNGDYTIIAYQASDIYFDFNSSTVYAETDTPFFVGVTLRFGPGSTALVGVPVSYRVVATGGANVTSLTGSPVTTSSGALAQAVANSIAGTYSIAVDAGGATGAVTISQVRSIVNLALPGGGTMSVQMNNASAPCGLASVELLAPDALDAAPTTPPPNLSFPYGLMRIRTSGCAPGAGAGAAFSIVAPNMSSAMRFWAFAPALNTNGTWLAPESSSAGLNLGMAVPDGGPGDSDGDGNGTVDIVGGIAIPAGSPPAPASYLFLGWNGLQATVPIAYGNVSRILTPATGTMAANSTAGGGVAVTFDGGGSYQWRFALDPPQGQVLAIGNYVGAALPATPQSPGIEVVADSPCVSPTGSFQVRELEYGAGGSVVRFAADVQLRCSGFSSPVVGAVRFNSTVAPLPRYAVIADAGPPISGVEGTTINLDARRSIDTLFGQGMQYTWTQLSGPAASMQLPFGPQPSVVLPEVPAGGADLVFQVQVRNFFSAPATSQVTVHVVDSAADSDGDGIPNGVEGPLGRNPFGRDNDVFGNARLFAMQQYRDFLGREGDTGGIQYYVDGIDGGALSREQAIENFFNSPEFSGAVSPLVRLYFATFRRLPDYPGLRFQVDAFAAGTPLDIIAGNFVASPEFQATYGALDNAAFVSLLYQNILGRTASQPELDFHVNRLVTGATRGAVLLGFSESAEYRQLSHIDVYVTMMYAALLRRVPEQAGFDYWVQYMEQGNPGLALIAGMLNSPEYRGRFQ